MCGRLRHNNTEKAQCGSIGHAQSVDVTCLKCKKSSFSQCLNGNANTFKTVAYECKAMQMGLGARKREKYCTCRAYIIRYHTHTNYTKNILSKLLTMTENYLRSDRSGKCDNNIDTTEFLIKN